MKYRIVKKITYRQHCTGGRFFLKERYIIQQRGFSTLGFWRRVPSKWSDFTTLEEAKYTVNTLIRESKMKTCKEKKIVWESEE